MKLAVTKRSVDAQVFVADLQQLKDREARGHKSRQRVVAAGALCLASLTPITGTPGFMTQAARAATYRRFNVGPKAIPVYVALDKDALELLTKSKARVVLAIDVLLRYGQKVVAEDVVVLGAFSASNRTLVSVLSFKKHTLVDYSEFEIAHDTGSGSASQGDMHLLVERLRVQFNVSNFHWCGPQEPPKSQNFTVAPANIWTQAIAQSLSVSGGPGLGKKHGAALAVIGLATLASAVTVYLPYRQYLQALAQYTAESEQLTGQYAFANDRLTLLQGQQKFFKGLSDKTGRLASFERVVSALSDEPTIALKDAKLMWPAVTLPGVAAATGYQPDFDVVIEVPQDSAITALAQSEPLITRLSQKLGMSIRLAAGSLQTATGAVTPNALRTYRIQGDFPHAR